MSKRGRAPQKITLTTGEDPSLWRYKSLYDALNDSIPLLAALIATTPTSAAEQDFPTKPVQTNGKSKTR